MKLIENITADIRCIVIGVSAGGFDALDTIVTQLPLAFSLPIVIVQHRIAENDGYLAQHLNLNSATEVKDVIDKEPISSGIVYIAPPDYHLLIERGLYFSLSKDDKVNYSRPSIDVLFESAADIYRQACLGIILTGKNQDGSLGLAQIVAAGGRAIVQNPQSAKAREMPNAAIKKVPTAIILNLLEIASYLISLDTKQKSSC
ncbi:MAG: chemotaxis protein CheB [Colwellia sp.]|nr:chemotaxis protein CheB [Colwellia sp.]